MICGGLFAETRNYVQLLCIQPDEAGREFLQYFNEVTYSFSRQEHSARLRVVLRQYLASNFFVSKKRLTQTIFSNIMHVARS